MCSWSDNLPGNDTLDAANGQSAVASIVMALVRRVVERIRRGRCSR